MAQEETPGPGNLGNPNEFTIKEPTETVIRMTGAKPTIVYEPLPHDDPQQRQPDISLAKKVLDWEPEMKLEEGLERTIWYFEDVFRDGK